MMRKISCCLFILFIGCSCSGTVDVAQNAVPPTLPSSVSIPTEAELVSPPTNTPIIATETPIPYAPVKTVGTVEGVSNFLIMIEIDESVKNRTEAPFKTVELNDEYHFPQRQFFDELYNQELYAEVVRYRTPEDLFALMVARFIWAKKISEDLRLESMTFQEFSRLPLAERTVNIIYAGDGSWQEKPTSWKEEKVAIKGIKYVAVDNIYADPEKDLNDNKDMLAGSNWVHGLHVELADTETIEQNGVKVKAGILVVYFIPPKETKLQEARKMGELLGLSPEESVSKQFLISMFDATELVFSTKKIDVDKNGHYDWSETAIRTSWRNVKTYTKEVIAFLDRVPYLIFFNAQGIWSTGPNFALASTPQDKGGRRDAEANAIIIIRVGQ